MSCLILAEHQSSALDPVTARLVSAARKIGGEIHLLVVGGAEVARQAAVIDGVDKVWLADAASYTDLSPETIADLLLAKMPAFSHGLAAASTTGKSVMPRVAALLDVAQISEIIGIESGDTFIRPVYAGNALLTVRASDAIKILTVRATAFEPAGCRDTSAPVETLEAREIPALQSRVIARELNPSARPELTAARVVVSGGRGLGSAENFHGLLEPLADALGGAIGASRAAVDAGYISNDLQVGQTGKIVAPQLYIAVGLSGAIQHVAGIKDSQVIVAINKNPEEPIFQIADYGLVADLFEAVPALTAALRPTDRST